MVALKKLLFFASCFLGCLYQVGDILGIYFNYKTVTELLMGIPVHILAPDLNLCIKYTEIFNWTQYMADMNLTNLSQEKMASFLKQREVYSNTTIADIYKYTPKMEDIFSKCQTREPNYYRKFKFVHKQCNNLFKVEKFYTLQYICYRFRLKDRLVFSYRHLENSLTSQGMMFSLIFKEMAFPKADHLKMMLSENFIDDYPDVTADHTTNVLRNYDSEKKEVEFNYFAMSFFTLKTRRLPSPYATNCVDYRRFGFIGRTDCINSCVYNQSLQHFNKVPFSVIIPKPINLKHISLADIDNKTIAKVLNRIELTCNGICKEADCETMNTVTKIRLFPDDEFTLEVLVPKEPSFEVTFQPKLEFSEMLIFVLSCLGTWFGVSIVGFISLIARSIQRLIKKPAAGIGNRRIKQANGLNQSQMNEILNFCSNSIRRESIQVKNSHQRDIQLVKSDIMHEVKTIMAFKKRNAN